MTTMGSSAPPKALPKQPKRCPLALEQRQGVDEIDEIDGMYETDEIEEIHATEEIGERDEIDASDEVVGHMDRWIHG